MNWTKQKSGNAASISSDTHAAHRSLLAPDNFYITVSRRKPDFKPLGTAKSFQEAILMCEKDMENGG